MCMCSLARTYVETLSETRTRQNKHLKDKEQWEYLKEVFQAKRTASIKASSQEKSLTYSRNRKVVQSQRRG